MGTAIRTPGSRDDEPEVPLPVGEFDQRVELVMRTPVRKRDRLLATALCEQQGWAIRPAVEGEDPGCPDELASLIVEVRLAGSRWGAESGARQRLLEVVGRKVAVTVAGGALVSAPPLEPMLTWRVFKDPGWRHRRGFGRLASLWVHSGLADVQRTIGASPTVEEAEIRERLGGQRLGGFEFSETCHGVRKSMGPRVSDAEEGRHAWWHGRPGVALRLMAALLLMIYGWILYDRSPVGRLAMVLLAAVAAWFVGDLVTGNQPRPRLLRWAAGAFLVGGAMSPGYVWHQQNHHGVGTQISAVLLTYLCLVLLWVVPRGCWFAVRQTWITRHAVGLLTVLVLPLPWLLPFVGSFLQFLYLEDTFGVPADAVSVPVYWTGACALLPTLACTGLLLPPVALYGWSRRFHWVWERRLVSFVSVCMAVMLLVVGGYAFMERTVNVADRAADDVANAMTPHHYFGIQGNRVCVRPLADGLSVQNGPLPTVRPLLTFSTDGEVMYLWDLVRHREPGGPDPVISVRSEEVSTYAVDDGENRCPAWER
ncbi:hypothetical protein [Streptomyces sp. NPDC003717]|uniref:hypothetical protein n=1 Tax=Streptomyces sp. NPDC003717 TaxID=3154276 RepID=UPI0033AD9805